MDDAAVGFAVAAGDQRGALGQLVLADLAVQDELVECGLYVESSVMLNVLDSYCMTGAEAGLWSHNISIGARSESLQKGHYPVVPVPWPLRPWFFSITQLHGFSLHLKVDFDIDIGGVQVHMAEPGTDSIDVNAGLK